MAYLSQIRRKWILQQPGWFALVQPQDGAGESSRPKVVKARLFKRISACYYIFKGDCAGARAKRPPLACNIVHSRSRLRKICHATLGNNSNSHRKSCRDLNATVIKIHFNYLFRQNAWLFQSPLQAHSRESSLAREIDASGTTRYSLHYFLYTKKW